MINVFGCIYPRICKISNDSLISHEICFDTKMDKTICFGNKTEKKGESILN